MKYKDMTIFFILIMFCFAGVVFGILISKGKQVDYKGVYEMLDACKENNIDLKEIVFAVAKSNILMFIIVLLIGINSVGVIAICGLLLLKGYLTGFSCGSLCMAMGLKGICLALIGVLLPSCITFANLCYIANIEYSQHKRDNRYFKANSIYVYIYFIITFFICVYIQSIIQYFIFYKM